ncbi:MAG: MBL fold metallo-hydrolase [Eubacterium sp.]|nr:MBL fold metallo-hydrolase [Eubacterium sp.]
MRLYSLASGSSGNCTYVEPEDGGRGILIDAGISMKRIKEGLENQNINIENVLAIFVTHEHADHISGLGPVVRKYGIPVYSTKGTIDYILESGKCGKLDESHFNIIVPDEEIEIDGIKVTPFRISHDAADPVGYRCYSGGKNIAVATDIGVCNEYIFNYLKECDAILLEANHDISMLQAGPYPYSLKLRILGNEGHLSNDKCAEFVKRLAHYKLKNLILGHLSNDNNYPELAYQTVKNELQLECDTYDIPMLDMCVAKRSGPTPPVVI